MEKLLELEKKLKEAKAMLEKKKEKKHEDEKEDKEMIADALDRHNEKKHGEAKDEDSAQKDMGLKKAKTGNKFGVAMEQIRDNVANEARQPATSIDPKSGAKTVVTPNEQVKNQTDAVASRKAKFEADAKARRDKMREEGVIKGEAPYDQNDPKDPERSPEERKKMASDAMKEKQEKAKHPKGEDKDEKDEAEARKVGYKREGVIKSEVIKFDKNGQWSMDKGDGMDVNEC